MIKLLWLSANHVRSYSIFEARTSNQFRIFQIRENLLYFAANTKLPTNTERKLIDCANFAACAIFIQLCSLFYYFQLCFNMLVCVNSTVFTLGSTACIQPGFNCAYLCSIVLSVFNCGHLCSTLLCLLTCKRIFTNKAVILDCFIYRTNPSILVIDPQHLNYKFFCEFGP